MPENPGTTARVATPTQLGALLQERRKAAGLSQQDLAEWAGVSRQYVSLLETGDVSLQVKRLFDLFGVLGCDLAVVDRAR
ncbi:helix-turn-helix domain-containing protein [Kineococcus sp. SYSU DK003]|uniref:helix-turn-helix domain-containing protein n=1 Tax=Kineococcus sp. SYSU DK003 TaxID=3383124 RepID=UPI003D7D0611